MKKISLLALPVLVVFAAFSLWITARHGYTGFLSVAGREPWALQMLVDLVLACFLYSVWLVPDARRLGITAWPYLLLTLFGGSIGGLAYLVHRGFRTNPA